MHLIFLLARVYPYWALALSLILAQLAVFFRRRQNNTQYSILAVVGVLLIGTLAWFFFRGDLHSDDWVRGVFGGG